MQEEIYQQARAIAAPYRGQEGVLVHALQDVQKAVGYLPEEAINAVADELGLLTAHVYGVASFYDQFHFEPRGREIVRVCTGTACHVRGASKLVAKLEETLDIKAGETTPDKAYTLETVNCLGCCALAPVLMVDESVIRERQAPKVIASLRRGEK